MRKEQVVRQLKQLQGERSLRQFARDTGISPAYLSDVLKGRREPGPAILAALSLDVTRRIEYSENVR